MELVKICDDFLIVKTSDVPSAELGGARHFCIAKPPKLRRSSYEDWSNGTSSWASKGDWVHQNENKRCMASGVAGGGYQADCDSGEERVDPMYAIGDKLMVKKALTQAHPSVGTSLSYWTSSNKDGMFTPNSQTTCGSNYFTADNPHWWLESDFMQDTNRDGRKWTWPSGAGGMPEGYDPYCIEICEGDTTKNVQILVKEPCD